MCFKFGLLPLLGINGCKDEPSWFSFPPACAFNHWAGWRPFCGLCSHMSQHGPLGWNVAKHTGGFRGLKWKWAENRQVGDLKAAKICPVGDSLPSPSGNSRDQMGSLGAPREKWKLLQSYIKKGWSTAWASEQENDPSQNMETDFQRFWALYNYPGVKIGQEFWQSCHNQNLLS